MSADEQPSLWDVMLAEAQAAFSLSMTAQGGRGPETEREQRLVDYALTAGVTGALMALRKIPPAE